MTITEIADKARKLARFGVAEIDPFTESEWRGAIADALDRLWAFAPEAFFVGGRVAAQPALPVSGVVPVLPAYGERLAAAAASELLRTIPSGEDQQFAQERELLVSQLEGIFTGVRDGGGGQTR